MRGATLPQEPPPRDPHPGQTLNHHHASSHGPICGCRVQVEESPVASLEYSPDSEKECADDARAEDRGENLPELLHKKRAWCSGQVHTSKYEFSGMTQQGLSARLRLTLAPF